MGIILEEQGAAKTKIDHSHVEISHFQKGKEEKEMILHQRYQYISYHSVQSYPYWLYRIESQIRSITIIKLQDIRKFRILSAPSFTVWGQLLNRVIVEVVVFALEWNRRAETVSICELLFSPFLWLNWVISVICSESKVELRDKIVIKIRYIIIKINWVVRVALYLLNVKRQFYRLLLSCPNSHS